MGRIFGDAVLEKSLSIGLKTPLNNTSVKCGTCVSPGHSVDSSCPIKFWHKDTQHVTVLWHDIQLCQWNIDSF
jgi:hypothetical protein